MEKSSTILLVEDHHLAAKVAKNILSSLNCQVDIAMDGKSSLEMFQSKHYDLIFMDIGLPDMNGYEVTRRIRSQELTKEHVPIIALTAHADNQNQQQCLDVAMNAVISKPLTRERAQGILDTFILTRQQHEEYAGHHEDLGETETHGEKIVDFEYAKKLFGNNEGAVREMLNMLVDSLPHEMKKLEAAYQHENWEAIRAIAHKLKGGASYCGTHALKLACNDLENYIRSGATVQLTELYQRLLSEMLTLQKFMAGKNPR